MLKTTEDESGVITSSEMDRHSFVSDSPEHYVNSLEVYNAKCGQRRKIIELLQDHLPELIQRTAERNLCKQRPECFNILSVGSGPGKTDLEALKIIKQELYKRAKRELKEDTALKSSCSTEPSSPMNIRVLSTKLPLKTCQHH